MLTKEPEMLRPDAFCEHTVQQNATAGELTAFPCGGAYSAPPDPLAAFKRAVRGGEGRGKGGKGKEGERDGKGGEGQGRGG